MFLRGQDFCFRYMFKTNCAATLLGKTKSRWGQKRLGGHCPRTLRACLEKVTERRI